MAQKAPEHEGGERGLEHEGGERARKARKQTTDDFRVVRFLLCISCSSILYTSI
jgi:hypothetical protein